MIKWLLLVCIVSQIKDIRPSTKYEIEIVTKKKEEYSLLTKDKPIMFSVEGPTYLRVYTRILWTESSAAGQIYKVILQENDLDEKIITLESEVSKVTKDKQGRPLSKWRSFYIEVGEGINNYKITHWSSPNDTILLKFAYESPKIWKDIRATDYTTTIEAIEEEKIVSYYELNKDESITLNIKGPVRLKVISRLNFDEKLLGEQHYTILVDDDGDVGKFSQKCYKSDIITYKDRKEFVSSNAKRFYINLREGWHKVKFSLSGTIATSVSLRFQIEEE